MIKNEHMTPIQRVLTALSFKEPDRVPLLLTLTMHGAKELKLSIKDYFTDAENVIAAQITMQKKYNNDFYYGVFYGPIEIEVLGGEVIFSEDGPPNSGIPIIQKTGDIKKMQFPKVSDSKKLNEVLKTIAGLKKASKDEIPIIGLVISPFSVPVMQMGFDNYIQMMYEEPESWELLMEKNVEFCISWANAQLEAGATAIGYFDPVSSSTIIPREKYLETGYKIACRTISQIKGPTATHFASGRCKAILDILPETKTAIAGVSSLEDLAELKAISYGKINLLGNLNGIEMRKWNAAETERKVREAINQGAKGGGFILSDNHGEIPYQTSEETILAISEAVLRWGTYPISGKI